MHLAVYTPFCDWWLVDCGVWDADVLVCGV